MAVTGTFLILFLIVHCLINGLIFFNDNGETFNFYAHFMGTNWIVRIMEIVLFLGFFIHIIQSYMLYVQNRQARPVRYAVNKKNANSTWYSRSMTLLGTLLLIFLVIHIKDFWIHSRIGGLFGIRPLTETTVNTNKEVGNLYAEMINVFQSPVIVVIYILGVISLAWHLMQGFSSAFQTFGLNHKKYTPLIKASGIAFSILIPAIFALMPISMYFGWIH